MLDRLRAACFVVAAGALVAVPAAGAHRPGAHAYSLAPVAFLGDAAPGGGQFANDFEPSAVANGGTVAFTADVTTGGEGVFVARNGRISQVLRAGLPAPGGGTIAAGEMGRLGLSAGGDVSVATFLNGFPATCGVPAAGVYRYSHSDGTLSAVVRPGVPAPGGRTFRGVLFNTSMNNRGDVTFAGVATGTDIDPSTPPGCDGIANGVYMADKHGTISRVVGPGDAAPVG